MTQTFRRIRRVLYLLLVCGVATGCGSSNTEAPKSPTVAQPDVVPQTETGAAKGSVTDSTKADQKHESKLSTEKTEPPKKATEAIPAEFTGLAVEVRKAALALAKLGAEVEVGVGEKVISVDLDGKEIGDEQVAHIAVLADLKSLNLSNTAVTDVGLKQLRGLKKLKFLYLFGTRITDAGMESIVALPRLEVLCLDQTEITDVGLKTLEDLPRLEKLHVHSKAKITDAGLDSLKKHARLFELRIGGPHLTEKAIEALKAALPDCNVVYDPDAEAKPE